MLATLLKRSKHTYFSSFFQNHINDLKNTWKSITRIISWKDSSSTVPTTIIEDDISLTNPKNIATGIQFFKKHSRNKFFNFLHQIDTNLFFINPSGKTNGKHFVS